MAATKEIAADFSESAVKNRKSAAEKMESAVLLLFSAVPLPLLCLCGRQTMGTMQFRHGKKSRAKLQNPFQCGTQVGQNAKK